MSLTSMTIGSIRMLTPTIPHFLTLTVAVRVQPGVLCQSVIQNTIIGFGATPSTSPKNLETTELICLGVPKHRSTTMLVLQHRGIVFRLFPANGRFRMETPVI